MLQRLIVKAKNCVPAAPRIIGESVVRSTAFHCGRTLREQTLPALAYMKMEAARDKLDWACKWQAQHLA